MPHSIAIDGPVGAGKSTVARMVAESLGFSYLDTGAMYRAMGLKMLRLGEDLQDEAVATRIMADTVVDVRFAEGAQRTLLDGEDVTDQLRTPEASNAASAVSKWQAVRSRLVAMQRTIAEGVDMVLDGRDIGTRVLPDATLKVFLTARPEVRARRRYDELVAKGSPVTFEQVFSDMIARDAQDAGRAIDPVRQAEDAVLVDTTAMTQPEVVQHVVELFRNRVCER